MDHEKRLDQFFVDVAQEITRAQTHYPRFHSLHEGYAILLEEVDELWELTKVKQSKRESAAIYEELVQICAMAARCVFDLGPDYRK